MNTTQTETLPPATDVRYAHTLEAARRTRWDIDRDVFRGRQFDFKAHFLPDGLSLVGEQSLSFLDADARRLMSQIQGRTYANIFGLIERFINAKVLELSRAYWFGDQTALAALVGFSQEELKHQEMFRRIERMIATGMPPGYRVIPQANEVAAVVLARSTWAVLALTCHIELFTQVHYRRSIDPDPGLSPLFKDVLLFHWKEESQHAILDELEWVREDARLTPAARDAAVDDFIALVGAVDGMLQAQASADVGYFVTVAGGGLTTQEVRRLEAGTLRAYRWQYILSGAEHPRFLALLTGMITPAQGERVMQALATLKG